MGSHVAREAISRGWEATGIDSLLSSTASAPEGARWEKADCRDPDTYQHLLDGVDVVYHSAAAPYEGLSVFSPQVVYENTLLSTIGLLRASINAGVKRFVFVSSMSRYGYGQAPFTEDTPTAPVDPYGNAKVAAEYKAGKTASLQFLIGQAMKAAKGSANPEILKSIAVELLK